MRQVNKIFFLVVFALISYRSNAQLEGITNCCSEIGNAYNRKSILNEFAKTLKLLVPDYQGVDKKGFYVSKECKLIGVFIYDLSDTLNRETTLNECIKFKEGHVYHFAPMRERISYSCIAILVESKVKIFRAINCPEKGDRLEDVVKYINESEIKDKESIIGTLRVYRKYGAYIKVDEQSEFTCK